MAAILSVGTTVTNVVGIIQSVSISGVSCAAIDISGIADSVATYVLGRQIGGTVDVSVICSAKPALPTANASTPTAFVVSFNGGNGCQYSFSGYIQKVSVEGSIDAPVKATISILVSGAVT
jgi:hypothetical protein